MRAAERSLPADGIIRNAAIFKKRRHAWNRAMELSTANCWDCPIWLPTLLLHFACMALALVAAARLQRARHRFFEMLGVIFTIVLFAWAASFTMAVTTWGIRWSDRGFAGPSRSVSWLILGALVAILVAVYLVARYRPFMRRRMGNR